MDIPGLIPGRHGCIISIVARGHCVIGDSLLVWYYGLIEIYGKDI